MSERLGAMGEALPVNGAEDYADARPRHWMAERIARFCLQFHILVSV
jgi:hypothetical protein